MKLTEAQRELLTAMREGVRVTYRRPSAGGSYYFRHDRNKKCSKTACVLEDFGLATRRGEFLIPNDSPIQRSNAT